MLSTQGRPAEPIPVSPFLQLDVSVETQPRAYDDLTELDQYHREGDHHPWIPR